MSGDVQPRKRKDKRKKKDEEELIQNHGSNGGSDEVIHVYKESKLGGNICSKIVFFGLLGALGVMVALIIFEYHGTNDIETQSSADSPWSVMLDGWVDKQTDDHDEEHLGHADEEHDNHEEPEEHEDLNQHDSEYSEGEHEEEEEVEDESFVQQTYEHLRSAYSQITPEDSDAEPTKDNDSKADDYGGTESEPEQSEPEQSEPEQSEPEQSETEEEEDIQEDDPLGQWKSERGPELLAEEVKEVQTESETEEESEDEIPSIDTRGGGQSNENKETLEAQEFSSEAPTHSSENSDTSEYKEAVYKFDDISNQADWEIKEELDEAERDLDEGDFLA